MSKLSGFKEVIQKAQLLLPVDVMHDKAINTHKQNYPHETLCYNLNDFYGVDRRSQLTPIPFLLF